MPNWLDYRTCPTCYSVIHKSEYSKHSCKKKVSSSLIEIAKSKRKESEKLKKEQVKIDTKYKGKTLLEMREIAKSLEITTGTKKLSTLIEEVLKKEEEVTNG